MAKKKHVNNNNPRNVLIGMLIGGLAGAVTMLLLAPQSGEDTRALIEEKGIQVRDQTAEQLRNAVKQVRTKTHQITTDVLGKAEELKHSGQEKLIEQMDRVSAALDAGKTAVEAA
jgi:gas vesicle protein